MQPIKYKDVNGYFLNMEEIEQIKSHKKAFEEAEEHLKFRLGMAEKDVEIARNESKYKLKKLASIIERKEKQIAELKARLGEA
jgi:hypothetical protein